MNEQEPISSDSDVASCPPTRVDPDLRPVEGPEADEELACLLKALGHPVRTRIVRLLARREACMYGDIAEQFPLALSTISQHLNLLKAAGLVRGTVTGPRVCYCIEPRTLRRLRALVGAL